MNGLFAKDGHFYLWDPSGNACQRLTSTGTVEYTRYVDAFGAVTKTDSITDSYGGMGGQWGYVMEGPFYRLGYRFYDPATGRFLTRDPIGYDGGINLYGYVENDPVNGVDADGLDGHHSFPKVYGGDPKQDLTNMNKSDHIDLHQDMQQFMKDQQTSGGRDMQYRSNNNGLDIRNSAANKGEFRRALGRFYRGPGSKYPDAARDFYRQCPEQRPGAAQARVRRALAQRAERAALRARQSQRLAQLRAEAQADATAAEEDLALADDLVAIDEGIIVVGAVVK